MVQQEGDSSVYQMLFVVAALSARLGCPCLEHFLLHHPIRHQLVLVKLAFEDLGQRILSLFWPPRRFLASLMVRLWLP